MLNIQPLRGCEFVGGSVTAGFHPGLFKLNPFRIGIFYYEYIRFGSNCPKVKNRSVLWLQICNCNQTR